MCRRRSIGGRRLPRPAPALPARRPGGDRYPTRILGLADRSPTLQTLVVDPRYLAVGSLAGPGHRPGDPFGERFAGVTAEGLTKRVGSIDGLVCLPWHNDCERGGLDLPVVSLVAERGDLTVHLSCTLSRSTHPTERERRVVYTGFALPVPDAVASGRWPGDHGDARDACAGAAA